MKNFSRHCGKALFLLLPVIGFSLNLGAQDPFYRAEVAHWSMGYEQSPVTSYYLGE